MPKASPPSGLLAMHGHSTSEIARQDGRSVSLISRIFNGYQPWDESVEEAILEVTGDRMLAGGLKEMARQAHLDKRAQRPVEASK